MLASDDSFIDNLGPFQCFLNLVAPLVARDEPLNVGQDAIREMGRSVDRFLSALADCWGENLRSSVGRMSVVLINIPPGPSK